MVSSAAPIGLNEKANLKTSSGPGHSGAVAEMRPALSRQDFLCIPPFPGAKVRSFTRTGATELHDVSVLVDKIRRMRVGGAYWGRQPELPADCILVRSVHALGAALKVFPTKPVVLWLDTNVSVPRGAWSVVTGECDPWHMLSSAAALIVEGDDHTRAIAAVLGVPCSISDGRSDELDAASDDSEQLLKVALSRGFQNPFTEEPMTANEAVELAGFWRKLIDSNRDIAGGLGFAFWKQDHVAPLLWGGGSEDFNFLRSARPLRPSDSVAVWLSKVSSAAIAGLDEKGVRLIEVEDGFLRSRGLGADCIPPLSISVDRAGAHFDPSKPSELERLLEDGPFDEAVLSRARSLRELIVATGLGKYESSVTRLARPAGDRRHILVPGQVEDDRSVATGGCGLTSNLELLRRVRARAGDAYILYKPHPDVLAGHRRGAIADALCLEFADQVVSEVPMASMIEMVDEVHVNTSLAGFEALLRGKRVTTYGVPFYAGWGLTEDLGPVPTRRTARRTLDELVAATLLLYPRYLDPVTGLPCPAEVVVGRLSGDAARENGVLVSLRRLQGRLARSVRGLVQ